MEKNIFRELIRAGAVHSIAVRGLPGGYALFVLTEAGESHLTAQRGGVRVFSRLDTIAGFLREMGVSRFTVDGENWSSSSLL